MAFIDLVARSDSTRPAAGSKQAIVWQKKALAVNPRNPQFRQFLMNHLTNMITIAGALGRNDEPVIAAQRELAELKATPTLLRRP